MSKIKCHTPGPWRVEQPYTDRNVFPISHEIYKSNCRGILAEVNAQGGTEIETSANARLIAAAPELLEACAQVKYLLAVARDHGYGPQSPELQQAAHVVREAITKAEGAI